MKVTYSLLAAALFAAQALAGTPVTMTAPAPVQDPAKTFKHLSGSFTAMAETGYVGRGLAATHAAEQGNGTQTIALKTAYTLDENSPWSIENTLAYKILSNGHTLYGNPDMIINGQYAGRNIKQCNMENEFAVVTGARYKQDQWNVAFGHRFVHGGILGVMAKHYRNQGASVVNEIYVAPEWTPTEWLAVGCTTSYSYLGIQGWWFEPYVTLKGRILGEQVNGETKTVVGALLTFGMSATSHYFQPEYNACCNGAQAAWIKLQTPWFATDNLIITPSVSFNWAAQGAIKANKVSDFKYYTGGNNYYVPFRNFAVIGGISATYRF